MCIILMQGTESLEAIRSYFLLDYTDIAHLHTEVSVLLLQMAGYRGFLKCPREGILCVPPRPTPAITEIPVPTTPTTAPVTVSQYCPGE